jgi:hypothetical protein
MTTWFNVTGCNPRNGSSREVFAASRDREDAQQYATEAHADGWTEVRVEAPGAPDPAYVATVQAEVIETADSLDALLAVLAEISQGVAGEDVAVWQGHRLVAVLPASGRVIRFAGLTCFTGNDPRPAA